MKYLSNTRRHYPHFANERMKWNFRLSGGLKPLMVGKLHEASEYYLWSQNLMCHTSKVMDISFLLYWMRNFDWAWAILIELELAWAVWEGVTKSNVPSFAICLPYMEVNTGRGWLYTKCLKVVKKKGCISLLVCKDSLLCAILITHSSLISGLMWNFSLRKIFTDDILDLIQIFPLVFIGWKKF
jgi:hypothetical protein